MEDKKGQVTVFIIIAVIIVFGVTLFFILRGNNNIEPVPADLQPVYNTFLSCLEDDVLKGIEILEIQGGYIELPELEQGSDYLPFSSQLNFAGRSVPYWHYVSGNGIKKEKIPSKSFMEKNLAEFVDSRIKNCNLDRFPEEGFNISRGEPKSVINIRENNVEINLEMELGISKANKSAVLRNHVTSVPSKLGSLYNDAKIVYKKEFENTFLENYTIDTLRFYAPVDGIELSCSPKTWNADEVFDELQEAIETNTVALRTNEKIEGDNYFLIDLPIKNEVRFINSKNWPNNFEVNPTEGNLLLANPIGNQQGLGILGFCYVPYHFVYNLRFPVMVQVYDSYDEEFFQFPIIVAVEKNKPREPLNVNTLLTEDSELCEFKNVLTNVNVRSGSLPVDANISFECLGNRCKIGQTENGNLQAEFPQCVNGFVVAKAEGFEDKKQIYSTVNEGSINLNLKKIYDLRVNLKADEIPYRGNAIITFNSEKDTKTINYPDFKEVKLSQGIYEIQIYAFKDSSLQFQGGTKEQCVGLGFNKRCFEIEIPEQLISSVLSGGGKTEKVISEIELSNSNNIEINFERLKTPNTLEQLQENYFLIESKNLDVTLK